MIKNYKEWVNESDNTSGVSFVNSILEEMNKRKMFPIVKSTDRQHKKGTLVVEFDGETSTEFVKRSLEHYGITMHPILMSIFMEVIYTGTPYTIMSQGTIKHKTGPGYNYNFSPDNIKDAVDWVENNAINYICRQAGDKYIDIKHSASFEINMESIKQLVEPHVFKSIEQIKKFFPNLYSEISPKLLFFCVLSIMRGFGKINNGVVAAIIPDKPDSSKVRFNQVRNFTFYNEKGIKFIVETTFSLPKNGKWTTNTAVSMERILTSYYDTEPLELTEAEQTIMKDCMNPDNRNRNYEEWFHKVRGMLHGKNFGI